MCVSLDSVEAFLLGLQTATFSQCPHMASSVQAYPGCLLVLQRHQPCLIGLHPHDLV